jgi:glycosyltransferase involved in cell wall biosynthesis
MAASKRNTQIQIQKADMDNDAQRYMDNDIQGYLELVDKTRVSGWILGSRDTQPSIFIYFDGRLIRGMRTNVHRPDVKAKFDTTTALLGFDFDIAADIERYSQTTQPDDRQRKVEVSISSSDLEIAHIVGSPLLVPLKRAIPRVRIANAVDGSIVLVGDVEIQEGLISLSHLDDVAFAIHSYLTLPVKNGGITIKLTAVAGETMTAAHIYFAIEDPDRTLQGILSASLHFETGGAIPCVINSESSQVALEFEVDCVELVAACFLTCTSNTSATDNYLYWFEYFRSHNRTAEISHLASLCPVEYTGDRAALVKYLQIWDFLWEAGLWAAFEIYAKNIQPRISDAIAGGAVPCINLVLKNAFNAVRCLCDFNYSGQSESVIEASKAIFIDVAKFALHASMLNEEKATCCIDQFRSIARSSIRTVLLPDRRFCHQYIELVVRSIVYISTGGASCNIEAIPISNAQILTVFTVIDSFLYPIKRQWSENAYYEILDGFRAACAANKLLAFAISRSGAFDAHADSNQFTAQERAVYGAMGYSGKGSFCQHSLLTYLRKASNFSASWMAEYKKALAAFGDLYKFSPRNAPNQVVHMTKPDENLSRVLDQVGDDLFPLLANENADALAKIAHITFDYVDLHHSHKIGTLLLELTSSIDNKVPCILLFTPWVSLGGADALCCMVANILATNTSVYVCVTEDGNNDGIGKLSDDVKVIRMNSVLKDTDMATREYLTAMMIEFINPLAVVNLNSRLAWRVLDKYGNRITHSRPYIGFFFCDDVDPTGEKVSYLRAFSRSANRANVHLLSDSVNYFKGVINELGLERSASHGILFPVQNSTMSMARKRSYSATSRILWSGRFDRQKRLDIALAVAKMCPHLTFDFYGFPLMDAHSPVIDELRSLDNVLFKGRYSDFTSIDVDSYDALLLTTQWEGTPNVALECGVRGLPIVAPSLGGLTELIANERGFPVGRFDDVLGFRDALRLCCEDRRLAEHRSKKLSLHIGEFHRQDTIEKLLSTIIHRETI